MEGPLRRREGMWMGRNLCCSSSEVGRGETTGLAGEDANGVHRQESSSGLVDGVKTNQESSSRHRLLIVVDERFCSQINASLPPVLQSMVMQFFDNLLGER